MTNVIGGRGHRHLPAGAAAREAAAVAMAVVLTGTAARTPSSRVRIPSGAVVTVGAVNDGAQARTGHGRGPAGIHERAQAVSGSVVTERTADGRFRLHVGIPEGGS
jgi:hypothetical protein